MANISQIKLPDNSTYNIKAIGLASQAKTISNVAIASFSDGADNVPVSSLIVDIDAVQDLHGQSNPYPDGGGKNKLPLTVSGIKAANTSGSWSGNAYTLNGVTFTILTDSGNNVTGISVSGTSTVSSWTSFNVGRITVAEGNSFKINTNSLTTLSNSTVKARIDEYNGNTYVDGFDVLNSDFDLTVSSGIDNVRYTIYVYRNYSIPSPITIYPMIRFASETDSTFAPYSNICPISGHSTCTIKVNDDIDDPQTEITYPISLGTTVYGGSLNVKTGELTITHGIVTYSSNDGFIEHSSGRFYKNELPDDCDYLNGASSISNVATYADNRENGAYYVFGSSGIYVNKLTPSETLSDLNTRLSTTPMDIVYPLATPTTVQLTPTEVRTLLNDNNIFADTGNVNELVYFKTGCESITELIGVMHDDSKMSYSNVYYKKTCNQLTDPGIYYNIDTTGSPAEGYAISTLITTYNCQILVYLGLVVNTRRVNHHPISGISFSPWKRLANEDDLDGAVIPYNAEYPSLGTIYDVIESIKSNLVKSVLLTSSMNCTYADSSTIGYRTTNADRVQVSTMTGYPTGKTILGYIFEYAYVGNVGEYYKIASVNLNDGYVYANSKVSGTVRFGLRVIYID